MYYNSSQGQKGGTLFPSDPMNDKRYTGGQVAEFMGTTREISFLYRTDNAIIDDDMAAKIMRVSFDESAVPREG